jgi:uncharacterized protein (TIGR03437 family)
MKIQLFLLAAASLLFPFNSGAQNTLANPSNPVDAATGLLGLPMGGTLATIYVSGLIGTPGLAVAPSSSPLPFELAGVRVAVNNAAAPILAVVIPAPGSSTPGQINFQVPLERNTIDLNYEMTISQAGAGQVQLPLSNFYDYSYFPGGFFADANHYAIAQHASDYSTVTEQNPAHAGETIVLYANNFFQVWPPPPIAMPAPSQPLFQLNTGVYTGLHPLVLSGPMGSQAATQSPPLQVLFAGLAPGLVGVEQLNVVVPANQGPGDWTLTFSVGPPDFCSPISGGGCKTTTSVPVYLPVR